MLWKFGIFSLILVYCVKKNLATLVDSKKALIYVYLDNPRARVYSFVWDNKTWFMVMSANLRFSVVCSEWLLNL
jgi:hypothetical protein